MKGFKGPIIGVIVVFVALIAAATFAAVQEQNEQEQSATVNENQSDLSVDTADQLNEQEPEVRYLTDFDAIADGVDELQVIDIVEGDGQEVSANATIEAHYTGAYAVNGEIFESSKDGGQPFTSPLSNLIAGWQEGLPGMKAGGTRRLIIPGNLAYGEAPDGYVPGQGGRPLGTLVFDIEVLSTQD